jgi:heat shock protein HtpX
MAVVGLLVLVVYAVLAALSYALVASLLRGLASADPLTTLALIVSLTLAFGYASYRFGTADLLSRLDADRIPRSAAPELYGRLDVLAARMGIDSPRLAVARMEMPNALAIGGGRDGVLVLDGRLFRLLDAPELDALLAHELAHLASRDSLVQTLAYSLVRTAVGVVMVALVPVSLALRGYARASAWLRGRPATPPEGSLQGLVGRAVLGLFVVLTVPVRAHSRRREFAADRRAAEVTGRPVALARALRKIERASVPAGGLLATLYVHAEEDDPLSRLLSTHPPMDERVERLVALAESWGRRVRGTPAVQ